MEFEWDAEKSQRTYENRGLSFEDAERIWLDEEAIEVPARSLGEERWARIGTLNGVVHTVIFTKRERKIRIISVRRAKPSEEQYYGKK